MITTGPPDDEQLKSIAFQSDKTRRRILLSYWTIVLVAIPLWWTTTSITRLSLPETRVKGLELKQLRFSLDVALHDTTSEDHSRIVEGRLKGLLHDLQLDNTFSISVSSDSSSDSTAYEVFVDSSTDEKSVEGKRLKFGSQSLSTTPEPLSDTLARLLFTNFDPAFNDQQIVQYASRYRLAFSLFNEDAAAGNSPLGWDIKAAVSRDIQPVLDSLSILHNFTIESQVQFFTPLAFKPVELENGEHGLTPEQLTVFVNSAEWTLSSGVSNDPILHFVLFVPSASRRPLRILDGQGIPMDSTAFVVPQWGSIFIYNPPDAPTHLTSRDLRQAFAIFRAQLLALLGIPALPNGVTTSEALSGWQLDALLRRRAFQNARASGDALRSIVSLVNQIEGMPVGKDVTEDVQESLDALDKMYALAGQSPELALSHSGKALALASRAFFNPGMLALLYFPPEHNLAVYTPLLAPVAVPLVVAVLREWAAWRKNRREKV